MSESDNPAKIFSGKKLLHVIGDSKFGGDTLYMISLADMFRQKGGSVSILSTTPETIALAREHHFAVFTSPKIVREISPISDVIALISMIRLCRQYHFDFVHTHTSKGGVIGRIGARLGNIKHIIHTIHGFAFHANSSLLERFIYENIERIAGYFCDIAISVNEEDRHYAIQKEIIAKSKIVSIKNGIDATKIESPVNRQEFREKLGVKDDQILIGTLSRFAEQKDPYTFFKAAEIVLLRQPNAKFLYAGDGPLMEKLREYAAQTGLISHFILPGFVTNRQDYLKSLDIFITTSLYEGMPIALLEAMCAGIPTIVTNVKGNRECVTPSCSLLVAPGNPDEVATAVLKLITLPSLRTQLVEEARIRFENDFSEHRMLLETSAIYEKFLG